MTSPPDIEHSVEAQGPGPTESPAVITIRRASVSDYPRIAAFIREAYEDLAPYKAEDRWNWQFVNNPYSPFGNGDVPVWIAETRGKVIGQIAVQQGQLCIDGVTHPAGWIVDVLVLPSHRGFGLGRRLYAEVARECPVLVTLTMAPATRRIAEKLGAIDLGEVKLHTRLVRLDGATVRRYFQARTVYHPRINRVVGILCRYFFAHSVLTLTGNVLLGLRDTLAGAPAVQRKTSIVETQRFGPEIDLLWRQVRGDFPMAFVRDSKFLNWRFCECPQMRYRCFTASRDEKTVGYLILRRTEPVELPQGVIVDLLAARQDHETIKDLTAFALEFFAGRVAAVQCATSIPEFAETLQTFGFRSIRTERPNCVVADEAIRQRLERSSTSWLFSKADHDWDQVRLA